MYAFEVFIEVLYEYEYIAVIQMKKINKKAQNLIDSKSSIRKTYTTEENLILKFNSVNTILL